MFDVFNLMLLGASMLANITLYPEADTMPYPKEGSVTSVSFHREWWRDDGKCHFHGVMVPYARDWEERVNDGVTETVLPPEPDKIAGMAIIVNRKECPGKPAEAMFRVHTELRAPWHRYFAVAQIQATELSSLREDQRPKWLAQVMKTIEGSAANDNRSAKEFLEFTRQALAAKRT